METYLSELTSKLVSLDTVSRHGTGAAADLLADELDGMGFRVTKQETATGGARRQTNVVAWVGPEEPGGLILSGHIDTVPFDGQPGWSVDPLKLLERDGRMYGRGTSDMKGFLAQCLAALRVFDAERLARPLMLILTCNEEVGCFGAEAFVDDVPELLRGYPLPRLAWIGEPTGYRIFHAHKGVVEFGVSVRGKGGHSSVPERGCNAIAVAARAVLEVGLVQDELRQAPRDEALRSLFPECPYNAINVGVIRGGSAGNMIADSCSFRVSYRPLPDEDPLHAYHRIEERLAALDARDFLADHRAEIALDPPVVVPGLDTPANTALESALEGALGARHSDGRAGAPFCTDAGQFARAGVDSLICGPGELDQAHQPDESIDATALERGPSLILDVVQRICVDG